VCIIIDNNLAARVLTHNEPDFEPVRSRLLTNRIRIAFGGRLVDELFRNLEVRRFLAELVRDGRAIAVPDRKIEEEYLRLVNSGLCTSDDIHVIALARAAPARVLVSLDRQLHRDFTNPKILNNPRGKVYQRRQHAKLLNTPCKKAEY
jgi:predicted nucleic acid-binding protein